MAHSGKHLFYFVSHVADGKVIMYADDTQFIDSDTPCNFDLLKARIESSLSTALTWFTHNGLKINLSKTEFLLLKTINKKINDMSSVTTVLWLAVRLRSSAWLLTRHSPGKCPESHIADC